MSKSIITTVTAIAASFHFVNPEKTEGVLVLEVPQALPGSKHPQDYIDGAYVDDTSRHTVEVWVKKRFAHEQKLVKRVMTAAANGLPEEGLEVPLEQYTADSGNVYYNALRDNGISAAEAFCS